MATKTKAKRTKAKPTLITRKLNFRDWRVWPIIILVVVVGIYAITASFADTYVNNGAVSNNNWYFPNTNTGYTNYAVSMTPQNDVPSDGYFYSYQFGFTNAACLGGYMGIQTPNTNPLGKVAIFSIWNAVSATSPQIATTFSGEGSGYSARIAYPWVAGRTYRLRLLNAGSNQWAAYVQDLATGINSNIGTIKVAPGCGLLKAVTDTFQERFSGPKTSCSVVQPAAIAFTNLTANNDTVVPADHTSSYQTANDVCPGITVVRDIPGGIMSSINPAFVPPPTLANGVNYFNVASSDGYTAPAYCFASAYSVGSTSLTDCVQRQNSNPDLVRFGHYSYYAKQFTPNTGWYNTTGKGYGFSTPLACANGGNYFIGWGPFYTGSSGNVYDGHEFEFINGTWHVRQTAYVISSSSCANTDNSDWHNVSAMSVYTALPAYPTR